MAKFTLLSTVTAVAGVCLLGGCGQSATNSSAEVSATQVAAPAPAPAPAQNAVVQPMGTVDQTNSGINYDQPGDRNVTVNAPFSATRVDRDTGSVHIDAPFVHIDKAGRGQKMHIDIGDDGSPDNSR